ncbi:MAG: SufD family Fe-S cluster assembly protein [Clostridia bacterium]|nr:SufD family Fe-S cluster assembly protein [Clostridia bacterium]
MDEIKKNLLREVSDLHGVPAGAYNIREDGKATARASTENIEIEPRESGDGIKITIRPGTKNESVHIPVIISKAGIREAVYNDFYIGEDADVMIVAGCGIHNAGDEESEHSGIHTFHVGARARVRYVEKHYGDGDGTGGRVMNPTTVIDIAEGGSLEMETTQIRGIDSTIRKTTATLASGATLVVREKIMTHGTQYAETDFTVTLSGEGAAADLVSRSVAKDASSQLFRSRIVGDAACTGHTECDAILMDNGRVTAIPELTANHLDASLIHEAAIGKIAGEQITKLMTLGLTEAEAEAQIISGFLK